LNPFSKVKSNLQDAEDFINYGHSLLIQKEIESEESSSDDQPEF
jgi:hypothetical protein